MTDEPTPPERVLTLTRADHIRPERIQWLWRGRIPLGELTLIVGRGGIGKSTMLAEMAAWITTGTMKGAFAGVPLDVLYVVSEDSLKYTVVPRLIAAGADLKRVHFVQAQLGDDMDNVMLPRDCERIKKAVDQTNAIAVFLDPLSSNLTGKKNDQDEMRGAMQRVRAMAEEGQFAAVGLAHVRKAMSSNLLDALMGSAELGNVTRSVIGMMRDPSDKEGSCVMSQEKNNLGRMDIPAYRYAPASHTFEYGDELIETSRIEWRGKTDTTVSDLMADGMQFGPGGSVGDCVEWLAHYLEQMGPTKRTEVIKEARAEGHNESAVKRAADKLRVISVREGFPCTSKWSLPSVGNQSPNV